MSSKLRKSSKIDENRNKAVSSNGSTETEKLTSNSSDGGENSANNVCEMSPQIGSNDGNNSAPLFRAELTTKADVEVVTIQADKTEIIKGTSMDVKEKTVKKVVRLLSVKNSGRSV